MPNKPTPANTPATNPAPAGAGGTTSTTPSNNAPAPSGGTSK
jgi:hypothetical protein